jgi:hypothetical protein
MKLQNYIKTKDKEKLFGRNSYTPFILESYVYSSVTNKWVPKTQKVYGDFEDFKLWNNLKIKANDTKKRNTQTN